MLVGTVVGAISFVFALLLGPETKGKELVPDLMVAPRHAQLFRLLTEDKRRRMLVNRGFSGRLETRTLTI